MNGILAWINLIVLFKFDFTNSFPLSPPTPLTSPVPSTLGTIQDSFWQDRGQGVGVGQENNIYELEGIQTPNHKKGWVSVYSRSYGCQTQVSGSWHFSIIVSSGEHKPC